MFKHVSKKKKYVCATIKPLLALNRPYGLQKFHDMLINLGFNANKNCEDDRSNYQGY